MSYTVGENSQRSSKLPSLMSQHGAIHFHNNRCSTCVCSSSSYLQHRVNEQGLVMTRSRHVHCASVGVATSSNGVDWTRAPSASSAAPSATAEDDKKKKDENSGPQGQGCVMQPGEDWWTFDTCHMAVSDVQVGN